MIEYLYFFIIIFVGVISFTVRKRQPFLIIVAGLLMAYVYAFNTDNNDYEAYYNLFSSIKMGEMDYINDDGETSPLFSYSMMFFKLLGANYNLYRLLMYLILSCLLYCKLKNKIEWGVFISGYGLVIFFFDLVQIRFAFSEFILLLALLFLADGNRWRFFVLIIFASLFHTMILPFVIFAFLPTHECFLRKVSKIAPYFVVFILIASIVGKSIILYLQNIVAMISLFNEYENKMEQTVGYGFLLYLIYQAGNFLIARICYKHNHLIDKNRFIFQEKFNRFNYMLQIIGFMFVIPAMININFGRYIRFMLIANLLNYSLYFYATRKLLFEKRHQIKLLMFGAFISLSILWVWGETSVNGSYPVILELVFNSL